jgi:hypothetical protein
VVRTPVRTPKANAVAKRWIGTVRRECLDHVLIFGRRDLQQVLVEYVEHYNRARPHRALELVPPDRYSGHKPSSGSAIGRRDILELTEGGPDELREVVVDVLGGRDIPVLGDTDIGHSRANDPIPLGVRAEIDAEAVFLRLLEPAVISSKENGEPARRRPWLGADGPRGSRGDERPTRPTPMDETISGDEPISIPSAARPSRWYSVPAEDEPGVAPHLYP